MPEKVINFFKKQDPTIYKLYLQIKDLNDFSLPTAEVSEQYYFRLSRAIVSQQLSTKAARVIWQSVENYLGDNFSPQTLLGHGPDSLRKLGLSYQKISYLQAIAQQFINYPNLYNNLEQLNNDQIISELTKIKGVGVWTAEMFLIFTLARPDVFSVLDLGLRKAVSLQYGIDINNRQQILELSKNWSPYRSYASLVLWKSLEINK